MSAHLRDVRDEIVGDACWVFSNSARLVRADRVEVPATDTCVYVRVDEREKEKEKEKEKERE